MYLHDFLNAGGPGGSGVSLILRLGPQAKIVLGDDYDLIGFDPRLVLNPRLTSIQADGVIVQGYWPYTTCCQRLS